MTNLKNSAVLLATCCWGLENNCTRKISDKSTYEIVTLKGIFSGAGAFVIALTLGELLPQFKYITIAMLLGFVAYGLSIFLYVRAQRTLGAAKTSAYYAVAPFIGTFLASLVNGEELNAMYFCGLALMIVGTAFVVYDTLLKEHIHAHVHRIAHSHNGLVHTHIITHNHMHNHFLNDSKHAHEHSDFMLSKEHKLIHAI